MTNQLDNTRIRRAVKTLILVDLALILGVIAACGALFAIKQNQNPPGQQISPRPTPIISYLAAGMGGMMIVMSMALPASFDSGIRRRLSLTGPRQDGPDALLRAYFIRNVLLVAMLEGAAIFNLTAAYIEFQMITPLVVGMLLIFMGLQIPSVDRVNRWIRLQSRLMESEPTMMN